MPNFFVNLAAFIVAISFLVAFHEWGHYIVARSLGVKVLRFSIGFGKVLWSKTTQSGVEFCISAIPLGGYVKMLDEREGPVEPSEQHLAFNRQNVWKRIAIVAAGPLANFILSILFFTIVYMVGVKGVAPIVVGIMPDSPASQTQIQTGDEFIAVDKTPVRTLMELSRGLVQHMDKPDVTVSLVHQDKPYTVSLPMPSLNEKEQGIYDSMGLTMGLPALVGDVKPETPAARAGIKPGDTIIAMNNEPVTNWMDLVVYVAEHPNETLTLELSGTQTRTVQVVTALKEDGKGFIGVGINENFMRKAQLGFVSALIKAVVQTYDYALLTLKMIVKMVTGQASLEHLSGPLTIAQVAGATAKVGLTYYLDFLAVISISLGVLNLLPVPVLDGGHLLYYFIEVLRGKPLTEAAQMIGLRVGLTILVSLMVLAFYNDILRLV